MGMGNESMTVRPAKKAWNRNLDDIDTTRAMTTR